MHFDEPYALNYEKGIIKLKNLINQNKPNCNIFLDKYLPLIKNKTEKSIYISNQNIGNNNENSQIESNNIIDDNNNNFYNYKSNGNTQIQMNNLINSNITNNNSYIQNTSGSILNNNIFNNKLLLNFTKKEKEIKSFESNKLLQKEQEQNNSSINMNNSEQKKISSEKGIKSKININVQNRNDYGELFKLNDLTSEKKVKLIKTDNNTFSQLNENENNLYQEENLRIKEENSINEEELREKFKLKEVVFKFILNEDEYRFLIQEKAKSINPFND